MAARSHLIPTQRPDKNGVVVTRHVRPEQAAPGAKPARVIPAAQAKPPAVFGDRRELHRFLVEHFDIEAIDKQYASEWMTAAENLDRDDPATLDLAHELMTTGPAKAREYVEYEVHRIIDAVIDADDFSSARDGWREYAPEALSPTGKNRFAASWSMGTVHEAVGAERHSDVWVLNLAHVLEVHSDYAPDPESDMSADREWWSGLAAAEFSLIFRGLKRTPEGIRHFRALIRRLGRSADIGAVAKELRSRAYLPAATALSVVEALDGVAAPLQDGAL